MSLNKMNLQDPQLLRKYHLKYTQRIFSSHLNEVINIMNFPNNDNIKKNLNLFFKM